MYVKRDLHTRSDLRTLDPSSLVMPFNSQWSQFLYLFTIFSTVYRAVAVNTFVYYISMYS